MDGWSMDHGWVMDGWMIEGWMIVDGWMMDGWMDGWMGGWMQWTDGWMDGSMDECNGTPRMPSTGIAIRNHYEYHNLCFRRIAEVTSHSQQI